jgi:Centrosomin N-terminal motif 1/Micro-tubular organiser Mto1 C-term Mto2-binding region
MSTSTDSRLHTSRRTSRLPGGFETEDELASEAGDSAADKDENGALTSSTHLFSESSSLLPSHSRNANAFIANNTSIEEGEMTKKLMDVESSFLPEISHIVEREQGVEGAFALEIPNDNPGKPMTFLPTDMTSSSRDIKSETSDDKRIDDRSPQTPRGAYETASAQQQAIGQVKEERTTTPVPQNTSSLETMSSSPTAAAAARTVSRVLSQTTLGGYETADEHEAPESPTRSIYHNTNEDLEFTPRKADVDGDGPLDQPLGDRNFESIEDLVQNAESLSQRPKYLNSRQSSQRFSYSSLASSNTETASDATLGADYALQSGGARPERRLHRKAKMTLSRSTSLGSIASGLSALSEGDETNSRRALGGVTDLSTLNEESPPANRQCGKDEGYLTPRASLRELAMPTDTVIANNVRDIEVPGTFAKQYLQNHRDTSPEKNTTGITSGPGPMSKSLTLKEHRSTVERLGKENFDLKMKIHFLDQALQKRSDDSVKDMITENVQLKSDKLRLERDTHSLRKQVRDLEKRLKEEDSPLADQGYGTDEERSPSAEEEVLYLRDRVESFEIEIQKLRTERIAKETEKRKLAEMVRSLGETRTAGSDVGSREERDMWKDMLEAETAAREQSEEDNKKLRDEMARLKNNAHERIRSAAGKNNRLPSLISQSSVSDTGRNSSKASATVVELERLQHENSELQKTISAQVSTLTSRNKEKERLYQEIEELKLGRLGVNGVRSVAGDSIFERSASRARSNSRTSNATRLSRVSDAEREAFENKIGGLRDQVSELRLENQNLKTQFDEACAELDAIDAQAQADADQYNEDLNVLTLERDDAVHAAEEQENAFQRLKAEAQEEIDGLGDELDQKVEQCSRLEEDLRAQDDNFKALQAEMRSASDGIVRLEEDAQNNLTRYKTVKSELDDANRELENLENELEEVNSKFQRLTVQQESSHNEIAFLREEQDADKIKIGDMESVLKATHLSLSTEKDHSRDLERRMSEERHQRDAVGSKEQEVQRVVNDLNREASTAKDEIRRLKKTLSSREIESTTWRERLMELENNLREVLGDANGTRSSLLTSVTKLQKKVDATAGELDMTRRRLDEKENLLVNRDSLLESSGLEYRKIADLLERERQARRADKHSFEQALKSHSASARTISQNNTRIADLENGRQADRRRMSQLDQQYKDQLSERNSVLLTIWKRLSAMCGPDWAHSNSLINGNLPSQEVIGNMLFWPGFSRNLLLAAKQVEGTLGSFKDRIKRVEQELWIEYQNLEHTMELRIKKFERVEELFNNIKASQMPSMKSSSRGSSSPNVQKLKGENRILKAELSLLQQQHSHGNRRPHHSRTQSRTSTMSDAPSFAGAAIPARGSSSRHAGAANASAAVAATLVRHHSTDVVEHLAGDVNGGEHAGGSRRSNSIVSRTSNYRGELMIPAYHQQDDRSNSSSGGQDKWIHRLRELERRLKAEREARLLDRSGARKRLEERDAVNEGLRMELERERMRKERDAVNEGLQMEFERERERTRKESELSMTGDME